MSRRSAVTQPSLCPRAQDLLAGHAEGLKGLSADSWGRIALWRGLWHALAPGHAAAYSPASFAAWPASKLCILDVYVCLYWQHALELCYMSTAAVVTVLAAGLQRLLQSLTKPEINRRQHKVSVACAKAGNAAIFLFVVLQHKHSKNVTHVILHDFL